MTPIEQAFVTNIIGQRNDALNAAAEFKAHLDAATARIAELEAQVKTLTPAPDATDAPAT